MPNYTLYYFNGRGRAEILRMMFAAAGQKYMDKRFEFNEWDKYRNDMPSMCVPVLEIDGTYKMPETMAICRYLAREFGFYPKNTMDMFRSDYIADCFYEIMHDYMRYYHWKNGRFRFNGNMMNRSGMMVPDVSSGGMSSGGMTSFGTNTRGMPSSMMPANMCSNDSYMYWRYMNTFNRIMPFLERTLAMRHGGNQYLMGNQIMWCDMMCYCCLENPYMENQSMFNNYPKLMALRNRVSIHPKISSYLMNRCQTMW